MLTHLEITVLCLWMIATTIWVVALHLRVRTLEKRNDPPAD